MLYMPTLGEIYFETCKNNSVQTAPSCHSKHVDDGFCVLLKRNSRKMTAIKFPSHHQLTLISLSHFFHWNVTKNIKKRLNIAVKANSLHIVTKIICWKTILTWYIMYTKFFKKIVCQWFIQDGFCRRWDSSCIIHSPPQFPAYVGSSRAFSEHSQYSAVLCNHLSRAQGHV